MVKKESYNNLTIEHIQKAHFFAFVEE